MDGVVDNTSSIANPIGVAELGSGILIVQPTEFNLSEITGYTRQIVTFTNTGTGAISGLGIATSSEDSAYQLLDNTCGSSLESGNACTAVIDSSADIDMSGSSSVVGSYVGGIVTSQFTYQGLAPVFGVTLSALNSFNFNSTTRDPTESTVVTLTNLSNIAISNVVLGFGEGLSGKFSISAYAGDNACTGVTGMSISQSLAPDGSCKFVMTYTNTSAGEDSGNMSVNYDYKGETKTSSPIAVTFDTVQSSALLQINPTEYNYPTIIANNMESITHDFVVINNGTDNGSLGDISTSDATFTIVPAISSSIQACTLGLELDIGESCVFGVRFGATSSVSNFSADIEAEYNAYLADQIAKAEVTGSSRAPNSANVMLTDIAISPSPTAGDGVTDGTRFEIESASTSTTVTLTYTNQGNDDATDFWILMGSLGSKYSYSSGTCPTDSNASITLESGGVDSCTVVLNLNRSFAGNANLDFNLMDGSWSDEGGSTARTMNWLVSASPEVINTQMYVNVYGDPAITFSPTSLTLIPEESKNVTVTLSGGYNVESVTVGLDTSNTNNELTATSCSVSSEYPTCILSVMAGESFEYESRTYTLSGTQTGNVGFTTSVINVKAIGVWLDYSAGLSANALPYAPYGTSLISVNQSVNKSLYLGYIQSTVSATSGKVDVTPVIYTRSQAVGFAWTWLSDFSVGPFMIDQSESINISLLSVANTGIVAAAYNNPTDSNKISTAWFSAAGTMADSNSNGVAPQLFMSYSSVDGIFLSYIDNSNNLIVKYGAINQITSNLDSWVAYGPPVATNVINNMSALSMAIYAGKVYIAYQDTTGIHIAVGDGTSWTDITTGLPSICTTSGSAAKLAANDQRMYLLSGCYNTQNDYAFIKYSNFDADNNSWITPDGFIADRQNVPYTNLSATIDSGSVGYIAYQFTSDFLPTPIVYVDRVFLTQPSPNVSHIGGSLVAPFPAVPDITMSLTLGVYDEPYVAFDYYNSDSQLYGIDVKGYPYKTYP